MLERGLWIGHLITPPPHFRIQERLSCGWSRLDSMQVAWRHRGLPMTSQRFHGNGELLHSCSSHWMLTGSVIKTDNSDACTGVVAGLRFAITPAAGTDLELSLSVPTIGIRVWADELEKPVYEPPRILSTP